ncbi:MAG: S8 family serine peptidase [candidate division Zixibacteria bacterium]|nr:S8 family serine peptidase [candidate division Zixibacteria bacterium]
MRIILGLRKTALLVGAAMILTPALAHAEYFEGRAEQPKPFVIKGMLEIEFATGVQLSSASRSFGRVNLGIPTLDAILARFEATDIKPVFPWRDENSSYPEDRAMSRFQCIYVPEDADLDAMIAELLTNDNVANAEKIMAMPLAVIPDDPRWSLQWAPLIMEADSAWATEAGSDTAKLAIVDSGVNYKHEDLIDNVWVNPGEDIDGDGEVYDLDDLNGIDDDGNGVIDDLIGYDFFTGLGGGTWPGEDASVPDTDPNDFLGHGTFCAGIAASSSNNGKGIAGIAGGWNGGNIPWMRGARIMCLRTGARGADGNGFVNLGNCATAIDYAARNGADAINCSWGSSALGSLAAAIALAHDSGISIIKAAGNSAEDNQDYMGGLPSVMSVAATTTSDIRAGFSNFGTWIEISAPGQGIQSTTSVGYLAGYGSGSGTSFAAPQVVGAIGILKSLMPSFDKVEIDSILFATADDIDSINGPDAGLLGAGRINLRRAIADLPAALFSAGPELTGSPGLSVDFVDLSPNSPSAWSWNFGDGGLSSAQHPTHVFDSAGAYDITLEVTEPRGEGYERARRMVIIHADTLGGDTVFATVGEVVVLPLYLRNTFQMKRLLIPISFANANGGVLSFDSVTTDGLRTNYFDKQEIIAFEPFSKKATIDLQSDLVAGFSDYLDPDTGAVINLYFTVSTSSAGGVVVPINITTFSGSLSEETIYGAFAPVYVTPAIKIGCCKLAGDADNSGGLDIADATFIVKYIFQDGEAPPCLDQANTDGGVSGIDISDATYLVKFIFQSGTDPDCGQSGS